MMKVIAVIAVLICSGLSFAGDSITNDQVQTLINRWLSAQNAGTFSAYASLYSKNFYGIRRSGSKTYTFDHDRWLKDREKMFKKKMEVKIINPEIQISGTTATVNFEQLWESENFKDKGNKLLSMSVENGSLKIIHEEMLFSKKIARLNGESSRSGVASKGNNISKGSNAGNADNISMFTSLKEKDCVKLSEKKSAYFDNRKLDRSECLAPKGWRLFTVIGGERYWLEIAYGNSVWTTEDEVVTKGENRFGDFQSVDLDRVEWRITKAGNPIALIFPVVAQDPETFDKNIYRFFVIKFDNNTPSFCGVAKTSHEAIVLANKSSKCLIQLPKRNIKFQ